MGELKRLVDEPDEPAEGDVYFVAHGSAYFPDNTAWTWLRAIPEEYVHTDGEIEVFLWIDQIGHGAHPKHWLPWEVDGIGWEGILGVHPPIEHWLLRHGLAPGQAFCVELDFHVWRDWETGWYEAELDSRVIDREPWDSDQILSAWNMYLDSIGTPMTIL